MASKFKAEKVKTTATVGNFGELTYQLLKILLFSRTSRNFPENQHFLQMNKDMCSSLLFSRWPPKLDSSFLRVK